MTHHRHRHRKDETSGPDAVERGYTWLLMALLGAIGVWLLVFSFTGSDRPAPGPTILVPIESPVQNVSVEPEPPAVELPAAPPEVLTVPAVKASELHKPEHRPTRHRPHHRPHIRIAPHATPAFSDDDSMYAYWRHVEQ